MIFEINPNYDEFLVLDFEKHVPIYYTLFANRKNLLMNDMEVDEDDCMIAYSNTSMQEIINHRSKLIDSGYHKATDLYIRKIKNFQYKKPQPMIGKPNVF